MERAFTVWSRILLAALFALVVFQATTRPLTIREAILWEHLVRPPLRQAVVAPDAWSGLLYAIAAKRTVGLFRLSELSLRLPALIACGVYLILAARTGSWVAILLAVPPIVLGWFQTANPHSLALMLCLCGASPWAKQSTKDRRAGLWFGLALAASPDFILPLTVLAVWQTLRHGIPIVECIVIPAITTAFVLLIIPLSHATRNPPSPIGSREEDSVRVALRALRNRGAFRISAAPPVLPLLEFYRARYRQRDWQVTDHDPQYRLGTGGSFEP